MKKLTAVFALMFTVITMAGCNTFSGMGKDIERGGEKIQNKAHDVQERR